MRTALVALLVWLAVALPIGLVIGRLLRANRLRREAAGERAL